MNLFSDHDGAVEQGPGETVLRPGNLSADFLRMVLSGYRFRFADERVLQDGIARALKLEGIAFEREAVLEDAGRIDFLVGDIGIEVKVDGGAGDILRQADRYLAHPRIHELLLIGTPRCLTGFPATLRGKPLRSHQILQALQ